MHESVKIFLNCGSNKQYDEQKPEYLCSDDSISQDMDPMQCCIQIQLLNNEPGASLRYLVQSLPLSMHRIANAWADQKCNINCSNQKTH